jgi:hypothetical protein
MEKGKGVVPTTLFHEHLDAADPAQNRIRFEARNTAEAVDRLFPVPMVEQLDAEPLQRLRMSGIQRGRAPERGSRLGVPPEHLKRPAEVVMVLRDVWRQPDSFQQAFGRVGCSSRIHMNHPQRCMGRGVTGVSADVFRRQTGRFQKPSSVAQTPNPLQLGGRRFGLRSRRACALGGAAVFVFAAAATGARVIPSRLGCCGPSGGA